MAYKNFEAGQILRAQDLNSNNAETQRLVNSTKNELKAELNDKIDRDILESQNLIHDVMAGIGEYASANEYPQILLGEWNSNTMPGSTSQQKWDAANQALSDIDTLGSEALKYSGVLVMNIDGIKLRCIHTVVNTAQHKMSQIVIGSATVDSNGKLNYSVIPNILTRYCNGTSWTRWEMPIDNTVKLTGNQTINGRKWFADGISIYFDNLLDDEGNSIRYYIDDIESEIGIERQRAQRAENNLTELVNGREATVIIKIADLDDLNQEIRSAWVENGPQNRNGKLTQYVGRISSYSLPYIFQVFCTPFIAGTSFTIADGKVHNYVRHRLLTGGNWSDWSE